MLAQYTKVAAALIAALATVSLTNQQPARADAASTAAIAGLAGLVVGGLLFDSSRNQYYYSYRGHRRYVTDTQARTYYQHADPHYYAAHKGDFNNRQKFAHDFNASHGHGRGGHR